MVCNDLMDGHIKHGGALWGNAARRELKRLGIVSNKAAKIIPGCGLERKVNELHNMMGWPRVVEYLKQHSVVLFSLKLTNSKSQCGLMSSCQKPS